MWLFPNQYGWRDWFDPIRPPHQLELSGGIAVYGDGEWVGTNGSDAIVGPRLPLIGLRALTINRLRLCIDPTALTIQFDTV